MSRATNMCQIDDCNKRRQKKTIFCKRHERKIPKKMMGEVKKFFRNHPDGYAVIDFDNLVKKCNFSLKIDDYEKRYKHYIKTKNRKSGKQKILVIPGTILSAEYSELWEEYYRVVKSFKFSRGQYYCASGITDPELLKQVCKDMDPCAVILLGEAGVRITMPPGRAENGIVHMGNQVATPEKCFGAAWKDRPSSPRHHTNYYFSAPVISCEPHPEEYDEFGKGEIREITKCLEWAKQFLHEGK